MAYSCILYIHFQIDVLYKGDKMKHSGVWWGLFWGTIVGLIFTWPVLVGLGVVSVIIWVALAFAGHYIPYLMVLLLCTLFFAMIVALYAIKKKN